MRVAVIDYGSGNVRSVTKALARAALDEELSADVKLVSDPESVRKADHIVLPGVGAFADCKRGLESLPGMIDALSDVVLHNGRPFLGICVGMQLLATNGFEHGSHAGLNWIEGNVLPVPRGLDEHGQPLKIPHMGWNSVKFKPDVHPIMVGISPVVQMYFVHSYHFVPENMDHQLATVSCGQPLCAIIGRETMVGTQFHPEKSQVAGLRLLGNFLRWRP